MTDFSKKITGFRYVQTQHGDTPRSVSLRELGDASGWSQLVWLNDLIPPYLTDDPARVRAGVLLTGSTIKVPSASAEVDASVFPDEVFQADCDLAAGRLQFSNGDIAVVSGRANLRQALGHRIVTDHGELAFHPRYGANLGRLKGAMAGPVRALVAADYVDESLREDARVRDVTNATATVQGDRISVDAEVVPITGININLTKAV